MAHDHHHHHHGPEPKLDEGAQALSDALKLMFRVLKFVMFGLIAYFIFSCFSEIEENEKAIVLRFGKIVGSRDAAVHEKGLLFTFPAPMDEVIKVPSEKEQRTLAVDGLWYYQSEIEKMGGRKDRLGETLNLRRDGYTLTASDGTAYGDDTIEASFDYNLCHTKWMITYNIIDPIAFVGNIWDGTEQGWHKVDALLTCLLQNAVIEESAHRDIDWIIWDKPELFKGYVQERFRKKLKDLTFDIGISVRVVLIDKVVPRKIKPAFDMATNARSDAKVYQTVASTEAQSIIDIAKAESETIVSKAKAYKKQTVLAAASYAASLKSIHETIDKDASKAGPPGSSGYEEAYNELLAVVKEQFFQEMLRDVIGNADEVFVVSTPPGEKSEFRALLSRDPKIKKKKKDKQTGDQPIGSN